MSPVAGKTIEEERHPAGYKLTDLPPSREVTAFNVLQQYQALGTDLADPATARHVQNSYQVLLEQLLIMVRAGQVDEASAKAMINTIVGMNQAVGEACYAVGNVQARIHSEAEAFAAARPVPPEKKRRSLFHP